MYNVIRKPEYDFAGQSYATSYPNLHKYPATMIPQIGIELFKELKIKGGNLLDPYCGSGSSFTVGLECGIKNMYGYDINPLAIFISKAKFTKIELNKLGLYKKKLRDDIYEHVKREKKIKNLQLPEIYNINFWFSKEILQRLAVIKLFIEKIKDANIKRFFLIPFSETVRECSYTRNKEFKLYKMKSEDVLNFNPDVLEIYFHKLNNAIQNYEEYYFPKLKNVNVELACKKFTSQKNHYDVVLTSPPYGDSRTTVAYGQFSMFSNEWLGVSNARKIDSMLMGGKTSTNLYLKGVIGDYINEIDNASHKRALEVTSFYEDLENSISEVAKSIKKEGKAIYVVGNRRVKDIQLPTDQFIAEKFVENGFKHLFTYARALSNKTMPVKNSPTNIKGDTNETMTKEYIVVCEK